MTQVQVTAEMVKALREKTSISLQECKKALVETNGDQEEAIQYLRKKGLSAGGKKSDRETKQGVILVGQDDSSIVMIEGSCETDFVANNERFKEFIQDVLDQAIKLKPASLEALLELPSGKEKGMTLEQHRNLAIQSLGENILIKRFKSLPKGANKSYGVYSHGGGKLVVIIELDGATGKDAIAKDVAMHAAALNPPFVSPEMIPAVVRAAEEEVAKAQIDPSKPANVIEKIVQGKIAKFHSENCLVLQQFVKDDTKTVQQYVESNGAKTVTAMLRMQVGQE